MNDVEEVLTKGTVVVNVCVMMVVIVVVDQMLMALSNSAPFVTLARVSGNAPTLARFPEVLPLRLTNAFCAVQLRFAAAKLVRSLSVDRVNWEEKSLLAV